jgi:hypothetical protein
MAFVSRTAGVIAGYPQVMPPERFAGAPVGVQQDIYQVGNLVLRLVCGRPAVSRAAPVGFHTRGEPLEVEDPGFRKRLRDELTAAVEKNRGSVTTPNAWLPGKVRETTSVRFIAEKLTPLLAWCLASRAEDRPRNCLELTATLKDFGVPPVGHLLDPQGVPVDQGLFPCAG